MHVGQQKYRRGLANQLHWFPRQPVNPLQMSLLRWCHLLTGHVLSTSNQVSKRIPLRTFAKRLTRILRVCAIYQSYDDDGKGAQDILRNHLHGNVCRIVFVGSDPDGISACPRRA